LFSMTQPQSARRRNTCGGKLFTCRRRRRQRRDLSPCCRATEGGLRGAAARGGGTAGAGAGAGARGGEEMKRQWELDLERAVLVERPEERVGRPQLHDKQPVKVEVRRLCLRAEKPCCRAQLLCAGAAAAISGQLNVSESSG
jgi:hypothetical protein